jgi:hypothetical protein
MAAPLEKKDLVQTEYDGSSPVTGSDDFALEFTEREYRKIVHRIDRRLVTVVGVFSRL